MLRAKTAGEIEAMAAAGALVVAVHDAIVAAIAPGVSTDELDAIAGGIIADAGATSSFLGHHGFPKTICTSINDVIIHGIPSGQRLRDGDVVSVDVGVVLDGWHGDAAWTYPVGEVTTTARQLLAGTEAALGAAISACRAGAAVPTIGAAVERVAAEHGLGVVADYGGHGIGRSMWEEPHVPNIADRAEVISLIPGMTLAIEPMLTAGDPAWVEEADGWTIRTRDGQLAAHFEHDVVVLPDGEPRVLTTGLGVALADVLH
ncbi:MAG TPA: type I methionyl aminopeptidase [Thermomicrobiales bacterium]|nr:type I methionyl aminopeptidase [Thermomicrobiales bacterium]